ncbi:MAG: RagB/SusD family nutrient uptake outer membrane protein [Prevotella sp.]|nr:RagB/SusD family nutrient uptake outer membrane protein [Prevotella sp.]
MKVKYITLGLLALGITSCSDNFLKEEMVTVITQDYFKTEQGLDQLIVSTYNAERLRHPYTEGGFSFELGHDCSVVSGRNAENQFSTSTWTATGTWNSVPGFMNTFMGTQSKQQSGFIINCYPVIDCCNKAIGSIRSGSAVGRYAKDKAYAASRLSEALFNRDYLMFTLNTLLGDVYFPQASITSLPDNFDYKRMPSEEQWKIMISDMRYAVESLPADAEVFGRITKYAAAHFLSKLYLTRAQGAEYGTSEYGRNADGTIDNNNPKSYLGMLYKGKVSSDLDSCIFYANMVINSGKYSLESNYLNLWKNGINTWDNESSKEIILAGVFGNGTDNYRYGNRALCLFAQDYVNNKWGIPDYTWENPTAPNTSYRNNDWGYDVYTDKLNDSRFEKSFHVEFKTALNGGTRSTIGADVDYYDYTSSSNSSYNWTQKQADYFNNNILPNYNRASWGGRKAVAGQHKMGKGDLAFAIIENTKATAIDVEVADAQPFVCFARWMKKDGKYYYRPQIVENGKQYSFVSQLGDGVSSNHYGLENAMRAGNLASLKYDDCNRTGSNSIYGSKDVPVFRLAETYLIRAEAEGRKNDYVSAINDINALRARAAYKAGEKRAEVLARLYPGHENLTQAEQQYPYSVVGDSYSKIKVDATYWDGASDKSRLEDYPAAATTEQLRFREFILNEYSRGFNEEEMYYDVLHHSGLQAERIQWHHQLGANPNNTTYAVGTWDNSDNTTATTGQDGKPKGAFQNYMTLKPFPQTFIDMLTDENNVLLTDEAKKAYQNYGYNQ